MKTWIIVVTAAASYFFGECERTLAPLSPNNIRWRADSVGVAPTTLEGIWGTSPSNVYAVGYGYRQVGERASGIWHHDGIKWKEESLPLVNNRQPFWYGIWGVDAKNIWVVGSLTGETFTASKNGSVVFHWNGTEWLQSLLIEDGPVLKGVWASSPSDVFVVGHNGFIGHFNGQRWSKQDSIVSKNISSIWGISSSDIYAGLWYDNNILHYDGKKWEFVSIPSPPKTDHIIFSSFWGNDSKNLYLAGSAGNNLLAMPSGFGFLYRGQISNWENVDVSNFHPLSVSSIYGGKNEVVYSILNDGNNSSILRIDRGDTKSLASFPLFSLTKIWAGFGTVFAVGTTRQTNGSNVGIIVQGNF